MTDTNAEVARAEDLQARLCFLEHSLRAGRVGSWRSRLSPKSLLELSDEAYSVLGVPQGTSLRNLDFFLMLHPDDRERLVESVITVRTERIRRELKVRIIDTDGFERVLIMTVAPVPEEVAGPGVVTGTIANAAEDRRFLPHHEFDQRLAAERELRLALEIGELFLEYQPILSLDSDSIAGAEALVRWQHPTRGLVPPEAFIGLAEESGLINRLGSWALRRACDDLKAWLAAGVRKDFLVSVNLSAVQLGVEGVLKTVDDAITGAGILPRNVQLEVTESVVIDGALAERSLRSIRDFGVRVAIDDFGTKYSSLSYLPRLPIDALKVDGSFVRALDSEPGRAVVMAITELGHSLGLQVIAEGVETEAQLEVVRHIGCDAAQGFVFSRSLDADSLLAMVMWGS